MKYTRQLANDFWYEFDELFGPKVSGMDPDVSRYYAILFPNFVFDRLLIMWWRSRRENNYPQGFINNFTEPMRDSTKNLTNLQFEIMDNYFLNEGGETAPNELRLRAFEDFAQGILYDTRRVNGKKIHKMEGDPPATLIGYYRWHACIRAMSFIDEAYKDRLLALDQHVSLAWKIEDEMRPLHDDTNREPNPGRNPNNPEMDPSRKRELESFWLVQSFEELDYAFDNDELNAYMELIRANL